MDLPIRVRNETQNKKKGGSKKNVRAEWDRYFGTNDNNFEKWQLLGRDLGIPEENLRSKTQIRKALKGIWINIYDFLYHAENKPQDVEFFESERQLSEYTLRAQKIFPRHNISKGSPLRELLAHILYPGAGGRKSRK